MAKDRISDTPIPARMVGKVALVTGAASGITSGWGQTDQSANAASSATITRKNFLPYCFILGKGNAKLGRSCHGSSEVP
jgi:hypothetical protein